MAHLITSTNSGECRGRETLVQFDRCALPDDEQEAVAEHVAHCPRCEAVLMELLEEGDSVLNRLRGCMDRPEPEMGPAFRGLKWVAETLDVSPGAMTPARSDLASEGPDEFEHRVFGGYDVYERIGKGGMGAVYRARHIGLNAPRALKLILPGRAARDPDTKRRFEREARTLARLEHPNVVRIHDFGEIDGVLYYAMELLEGMNLRQRLRPLGGCQPPVEAARTVLTLALAMHDVHELGVLHRDLKTSNIVVGPGGKLTIVDFGLAKRITTDPEVIETVALTGDLQVLGTPPYISPEQAGAFGKAEVSRASDVYSLGAILYELLTGRPPFEGTTVQETLHLVCTTEPTPPSRERAEVDFGLESICLKCLEKPPRRRYDSALDLADHLGRWLDGERPGPLRSTATRARRFVARNSAWAVVLLIAAVALGPPAYSRAVAFWNSPTVALWGIESRMKWGLPVALIGPTGEPRWSRWLCGKPTRAPDLAADGTFTLETWSTSILQLAPDPHCERFRITAQVRHSMSELDGGVGLFVGQTTYPYSPADLHLLTRMCFNAVRGDIHRLSPERMALVPERLRVKIPPPKDNRVTLDVVALTDQDIKPSVLRSFATTLGPGFKELGVRNGVWHELELTVTPTEVTARWNGSAPFTLKTDVARRRTDVELSRTPLPNSAPAAPPPDLRLNHRGGVGLYLWGGMASFRNVVLTPL